MDAFQYGVFKLGQIWTLADQDGARLGFPSRELAIAALQAVIAVHRACGASVIVTLQDNAGRLRTLSGPVDDLALNDGAQESSWGALMDFQPSRIASARGRAAPMEDG
jgi:hypothetical protein